jgi:IMP dehydrogenase/GMP reductase
MLGRKYIANPASQILVENADGVKVGIGPGSICRLLQKYFPQFSAVLEVAAAARTGVP